MVGHHYVEQLVSSNIEANITVIGGEPRPAYDQFIYQNISWSLP